MASRSDIKSAFERNARAVGLRPTKGQGTAITRVCLQDGLRCEIEEGPWKLVADMGPKSGGEGTGPNPGVLGRGALGSCLAMSYAMWAAVREVPLETIEVEIQADYDARGEYGVSDRSPAYLEVRYVVTVETDAPEEAVVALLDEADTRTPYLAVFATPQRMRRDLRITAPRR